MIYATIISEDENIKIMIYATIISEDENIKIKWKEFERFPKYYEKS